MSDRSDDIRPRSMWRAWLLPLLLLAGVLGVFALGKAGILPGLDGMMARIEALAGSPWAVPGLIGVFCVGAYLGVPQFALFGAAVVAFGPWMGTAYAWGATLVSGTLTYWTGRFGGRGLFARFAGARAQKLSGFLERNAFKSSALVRLVPTGPFLIVNMAFGVSRANFFGFLAGLGVGAWPKLIVVALAAQGLVAAEQGTFWVAVGAVLIAILVWAGMAWLATRSRG